MARRRKQPQDEDEGPAAGVARNGFDPATAKAFVNRLEGLADDLASERGSYMQRCREIRATISSVLDDAATEGLPRKELKAVIKARRLELQANAIRDDLEEADERETYDQIRIALGDFVSTPLGEAALGRAVA